MHPLRKYRRSRFISLMELCRLCKLDEKTVLKIERGITKRVRLKTQRKIIGGLGLELTPENVVLLFGEDQL